MTSRDASRILVRTPNWLGDNVMALPALAAVRRALPRAHIAVHTRAPMHRFWSMTDVDDVIPLHMRRGVAGLYDRWDAARDIGARNYDAAVLLPNSFDSALLARLAGIRERAGRPTDGRRCLLTDALPRPTTLADQPQWRDYAQLLSAWLGREIDARENERIAPPDTARAEVRREIGDDDAVCVGLNPGSTYGSAKRWFPERFADVAARLHERNGARIVIVGGPGDVDVCEEVCRHIRARDTDACRTWCISTAGRTDIPRLAAWLERCTCVITNDTGAMHVSAVVGTPVVALFGPTDWSRTPPLGDSHTLLTQNAPCAPCLLRRCPRDHVCMTSLSADDVYAAAARYVTGTDG